MKTVAHRIFDLARTQGHLPALSRGYSQVTFAQLVRNAVQLAGRFAPHLRDKAPIAIATKDAREMVTAALASWLLGCPYLPLDPCCPKQRLGHMLDESRAAILATSSGELRHIEASASCALVTIDLSEPEAEMPVDSLPVPAAFPEDAAYIIYTSGSTGLPKGVIVSHANLSHFVAWYHGAFSPSPADRATQFASLTFDASVFEMWPPLAAGSSLWPIGSAETWSKNELKNFLVHNNITHCFASTAIAEDLLDLEWPEETRLRFLLTGADTLRRFPPAGLPFQLINNYGPTECTVLASSGVVRSGGDPASLPSIGRPISGATILILDETLQPTPPGMVGEIFIGGDGVALGYAGQPALTAERFLNSPFDPSARLYRTGDRGRFSNDGELEFCGRLDAQLKLRGYRIEPDEIVQRLRLHQSVHACAVRALGSGGKAQLAVYLELNEPISSDDLRDYLTDHLPNYMIPDVFVQVARLPLNDHGKVDLAALPFPTDSTLLPLRCAGEETAKSEIETQVAAIVAQLLKRSSVSVTDNFFRLGGHSLLAAQVITRIRQSFGVDVSLRSIFESPTVAALASAIEQKILATLASMPVDLMDGAPPPLKA